MLCFVLQPLAVGDDVFALRHYYSVVSLVFFYSKAC